MGGTSKSESKSDTISKTEPWFRTIPALGAVLNAIPGQMQNVPLTGAEDNALRMLSNNANQGNPFAPAIGQLATDLLGGGPDRTGMVSTNLDEYRTALQPFATGSTNPWENADFRRISDDVTSRTMDKVKSSYQGAGIPAAAYGDFAKTAGEGITSAIAPLAYQAGRDLTSDKRSAIDSLYGAGNTSAGLLSAMDQQGLQRRADGVQAAQASLAANDAPWTRILDIEAQRRGIPLQNLAAIENLILPMAQLGQQGQSTTWQQQSKTASPMETAMGWAKVGTSLFGGGSGGGLSSVWR